MKNETRENEKMNFENHFTLLKNLKNESPKNEGFLVLVVFCWRVRPQNGGFAAI
jgi:hypothetical protein